MPQRLNAILLAGAIAFAAPLPAFADRIEAEAQITAVTLYPWGATVTRRVSFDADAGVHDLLIPGLPRDTAADRLRVLGGEGAEVGSATLIRDRQPLTDPATRPEVAEAEDEIERLEARIRDHNLAIAEIRARATAAEEQIAFLKSLAAPRGKDDVATGDLDTLRGLTRLIGEEVLTARQTILAAEAEAETERRAKAETEEQLADARQHLRALIEEGADKLTLSLAVAASGGTAELELTTFTQSASWMPVYDLRLTRGEAPSMTLDRGVQVSQASGEDWRGVELTLSTARPSGQSAPSELWPELRRIFDPTALRRSQSEAFSDRSVAGLAMQAAPAPPPMAAEEAEADFAPQMVIEGATVTYRYPRAVDLRDGVEDLRLSLDSLSLAPELSAIAVPRRDTTAFLEASFANDTGQILLPGAAALILDGAMIGSRPLGMIAEGETTKVGFGPIDGLQLTRRVPDRVEGDNGVFTTTNEIREQAVIEVENLTGETWPLRVLDQVPYSEQEDLEINWSATPRPSEEDVDDRRGVLAWDLDITPGETREIQINHRIQWPGEMILQ